MRTTSTVLLLACLAVAAVAHNTKLKEVFVWKQLDFNYPNDEARETAKLTGNFIPKNNLPLGLEAWRNRVFVTVPRWKSGVPASLTYTIHNPNGQTSSPNLIPYPDWETNALPKEGASANETHIISTFRVRVDACDRLWVMDTGLADILGSPKSYVTPQILIYDLHTDKLVKKFSIPADQIKEHTFFANIIVDTDGENGCEDAFAYIPDLGSFAVVVYSLKDDESWRVKHHFFNFDPLNGDYNVGGVNFQWTDGIFGIALSERNEDGFKTAYFHALSSTNEFKVSTEILRNKTAASDSYHSYKLLGSRGPNTQSSASFLDEKSGVLFYTQVNRDGVGCWNTKEAVYSEATQGLVTQDNETFVFTNDLKVDRDSNLWVLSDRMPAFIYRELDPEQVNFRIFTASVQEAIRGTVCERVSGDKGKEEMKLLATEEHREEMKYEQQVNEEPKQIVRTVSNVMRSFSRKV